MQAAITPLTLLQPAMLLPALQLLLPAAAVGVL